MSEPRAENVAKQQIVKALEELPDVHPMDDPFPMVADVALAVLRALPVDQRMEAMGMEPTEVLAALGGVYNGKSTGPFHWWRLPIEGSFDA